MNTRHECTIDCICKLNDCRGSTLLYFIELLIQFNNKQCTEQITHRQVVLTLLIEFT